LPTPIFYTDRLNKRTITATAMTTALYLDCNATTPVLPAALEAATRTMATDFGNPSSSHAHGLSAKAVLTLARQTAAEVIGAGPGQVLFTSGATEGIQTAVLSALCTVRERRAARLATGNLLIYGATEHKAVPQALAHWNQVLGLGLALRALPVNTLGQHDLTTLAQWLPDAALLCTMAANNETGVISDIDGIGRLLGTAPAHATRPLWLVDCVQALGKIALKLAASPIDYAVFSGHKLYAPKGVGLLYVRDGAPFTALMAGGGQEAGLRSGTENMPAIAAFATVLQALQRGDTFASAATLYRYRETLADSLRQTFAGVVFNGSLDHSLPTTLNFSVPGLSSATVMEVLAGVGLQVSAGSACSAAKAAPSDVLSAMGLPAWRTTSAVRLSFGPLTTESVIQAAALAITRCQTVLQAIAAFSLSWHELGGFYQRNPGARLVDVREEAELQASEDLGLGSWVASKLPLSALTALNAIPTEWLDAADPPDSVPAAQRPAPVVLFCRSGQRSQKAANWLRRLGHSNVWHVHGGLVLRGVAPAQRLTTD
jgi:cysteine desulfurase